MIEDTGQDIYASARDRRRRRQTLGDSAQPKSVQQQEVEEERERAEERRQREKEDERARLSGILPRHTRSLLGTARSAFYRNFILRSVR